MHLTVGMDPKVSQQSITIFLEMMTQVTVIAVIVTVKAEM